MKTRSRRVSSNKAATTSTHGAPPTIEEIRQRAHQIFLERRGTPGSELDDWLRAEQELKQNRTATNTDTA